VFEKLRLRGCACIACAFGMQDAVFCSLSRSQFIHALSMCGLAAFSSRRMQSSPLREPEQQLAAFLAVLGLTPLPGQQLAAPVVAAAGDAGAGSDARAGHGKKSAQKHSSSGAFSLCALKLATTLSNACHGQNFVAASS
jgi:hypothetical protein